MARKVALIHYRLLQAGGLENRILNYSHWFSSHGWEVHLICTKFDPDFPVPAGAKVHVLKKLPLPKVFNMWAFDRALGDFMRRHTFDFSLAMGRTSHQEAVLAPGNHLGYLRANGRMATSISDRMQIKMDRKGHDHSKIIFAASEMMRNELIELYGAHQEKVHVLYPPLDTNKFSLIPSEEKIAARKAANIPPETRVFAFVSASHERKGLNLLRDIMGRLKGENVLLLLAGSGSTATLPGNIINMGFVKDMREVYRLADFLVHPAIYEPYGQIIPEAVSCGIPVIVSDRCGAAEILTEKEGIVLPWNDAKAWERTMKNIKKSEFEFSDSWAEDKGLSTDHHLRRMLSLSGKI